MCIDTILTRFALAIKLLNLHLYLLVYDRIIFHFLSSFECIICYYAEFFMFYCRCFVWNCELAVFRFKYWALEVSIWCNDLWLSCYHTVCDHGSSSCIITEMYLVSFCWSVQLNFLNTSLTCYCCYIINKCTSRERNKS